MMVNLSIEVFLIVKVMLDEYKVMDYYEKGHTIIISNVFDLTEELRMFEGAISDSLLLSCSGNFYWSKSGDGGFSSHGHTGMMFL